MDAPTCGYEGHPVFRNHPPYTYFETSFDRATDMLFLSLNEVHPHFLQMKPESDFQLTTLRDPRTNQIVDTIFFDHSSGAQKRPKVFRSGISSTLNKMQHLACLRVLQAWQYREEVDENDLAIWRKLTRKRSKEKCMFETFLLNYVKTNTESIYAPTKRLVPLYQRLYAAELENILANYKEDIAYNTHMGLPHVRCLNSDPEKNAKITSVRLVAQQGLVPAAPIYTAEHFMKLNINLDNLIDYYVESLQQCGKKNNFTETVSQQIKEAEFANDAVEHIVYIPLEALLFLLTSGDSIDLPTETILEIQNAREENKIIKFKTPFPARNCGWHTYNRIVEAASIAQRTLSPDSKWLSVQEDTICEEATKITPELYAVTKKPLEYKPVKYENYISGINHNSCRIIKTNDALVEWRLEDTHGDSNDLHFFTQLHMPPTLGAQATSFLGGNFIKLEYKTEFGAEIMTKYELLKAWLQLVLTQSNPTPEHHAKCMRISATDFSIQLEEHMTLLTVEKQLLDIYKINVHQLLAGLSDFFHMLLKMPVGEYMLRYTDKYKDKLLLCAPSKEITQNTIYLHQLLKNEPSDLAFMTQALHLPISDTLCSAVHLFHKWIPCMFLPRLPNNTVKLTGKPRKKVLTDEEFVQKSLQKKAGLAKEKLKLAVRVKKRKKRKIRKLKKATSVQQEQEQQKELDKLLHEC